MAAVESYPADLKYNREHDWVRIDGSEAVFGITWKAQDMLGEIVFFQAPEIGAVVTKDGSYGEVESVKAVSDLVAPLSGKVVAVNEKMQAEPETVNADPYGEGWLVRVQLSDPSEAGSLLDAGSYEQFLAEE
ncbi:MAG: glycine cleavage system protein GcvH [Gaiellaceae bacterium]|jgi:glycine cleavage system H protein